MGVRKGGEETGGVLTLSWAWCIHELSASNLSHFLCIDTWAQEMEMGVNELSWGWSCRFGGLLHSLTKTEQSVMWENVINIIMLRTVYCSLYTTTWISSFLHVGPFLMFACLCYVEGWWPPFLKWKSLFAFSVQGSTIQSGGVWIRRLHLAYWSVLQKQGTFNYSTQIFLNHLIYYYLLVCAIITITFSFI